MILEPGSSLGPYIIQAQIGSGGMGVVYRALDPKLERRVAIKVLPAGMAGDPVRVARFEREAKAVAALSHPNVLGIFDFVRAGGAIYAVMELLEGENLRQALRDGPLPLRKALDIATQLALGLAAAHEKGLLHRDIKPENIFLCNDGQVKLLDFGLAKPMPRWNPARPPIEEALTAVSRDLEGPDPAPDLPDAPSTRAGMVMGTMGYMSPEQIRGEELDARSDIFSFGVVLFELLTGQRAFRRDSAAQTFEAILSVDLPEFRTPRGPLPPALEHLVAHCLEKRPEARFQSMRDLAFALQHLEPATTAHPALSAAPPRSWRRAWPLAAAALCAVLTGGGTSHGPLAALARLLAWLIAALALAWILGLFHTLLQGLDLPELAAAVLLLATLVVWPMVWPNEPEHQSYSSAGNLLLVFGLGIALWLSVTSPWSARHPRIAMPLYVIDRDSGQAFRVSPYAPDPWVRDVLTTDGGAIKRRVFPGLGFTRAADRTWAAAARPVTPPPFALTFAHGADGTVSVHATGQADGMLDLQLRPGGPVGDVRINGAPTPVDAPGLAGRAGGGDGELPPGRAGRSGRPLRPGHAALAGPGRRPAAPASKADGLEPGRLDGGDGDAAAKLVGAGRPQGRPRT